MNKFLAIAFITTGCFTGLCVGTQQWWLLPFTLTASVAVFAFDYWWYTRSK